MSFFKQFPKTQYNFKDKGSIRNVVNVFKHVDVKKVPLDGYISYTYYDVKGGDRPDTISTKLYGTPDYYWTFFILNNSLKQGLRAWPKSQQELEKYIANRYDDYKIGLMIPQTQETVVVVDGTQVAETITTNTFNGLDMTHPFLRLRKKNSTAYALVDRWDPELFQLTLRNVHSGADNFFEGTNDGSFNGRNIYYVETYNPFTTGETQHTEVETLNAAWRVKYASWTEQNRKEIWSNWKNSAENTAAASLSTIAQNIAFEKYMTTGFEITLYAMYDGRNAPYKYLAATGSTEEVSAQNALFDSFIPADQTLSVDRVDITNAGNNDGTYLYDTAENFWQKNDVNNSGLKNDYQGFTYSKVVSISFNTTFSTTGEYLYLPDENKWSNVYGFSFFNYFQYDSTANSGAGGWRYFLAQSSLGSAVLPSTISEADGFWSATAGDWVSDGTTAGNSAATLLNSTNNPAVYTVYDSQWKFIDSSSRSKFGTLPSSFTESQGFWAVSGQINAWTHIFSDAYQGLRNAQYQPIRGSGELITNMGNQYDIAFAQAPYQTNWEREVAHNDSLQRIRVVKKKYIQEFAEEYKDLLNS